METLKKTEAKASGPIRGRKLHPKEYSAWDHMIQRCRNPNCKAYRWYGGRGITVCDEWKSFAQFFKDMGPSPHGFELDRVDNSGNYCASNCRWISKLENSRNTRWTKLTRDLVLEIRKSTESTRALSRRHNIHHAHISRVKRGLVWGDIVDPKDCNCNEFVPVFPRLVTKLEKKEVD